MSRSVPALGAALIVILAATPAAAQEGADRSRVVDELAACRSITDSSQRLACFDRTSATLVEAREKKEIVVLDKQDVRATKRSLFGFSLPKIKLFGAEDDTQVTTIESTISNLSRLPGGLFTLALADGTQWQTTESVTSFPPEKGGNVRIEAAMLGGYRAYFGRGNRFVRIKRIG